MRRIGVIAITVACMTAPLAQAGHGPSATRPESKSDASSEDRAGWPKTPAGAIAARWIEAFGKGEKAMRAALPDLLAPESLARVSMDERMERYRGLQEKFGSLLLVEVETSSPDSIVAVLAASDLSQRLFTFKFKTAAPVKLISVSYLEQRHMMHGGFSH